MAPVEVVTNLYTVSLLLNKVPMKLHIVAKIKKLHPWLFGVCLLNKTKQQKKRDEIKNQTHKAQFLWTLYYHSYIYPYE